MRPIRKLRRGQTLTPFGVGAVFDVLGESFVAEDITRWKGSPEIIKAPRLTARLGISHIRTAPPAPTSNRIEELIGASGMPFWRFPRWLFCSSCRVMTWWRVDDENWGEAPRCKACNARRQLTPMRFIMICGNGHLDDVDWRYWAHSDANTRNQKQCQHAKLRFLIRKGVGGGLQSLVVRCDACGAERSLKGIAFPNTPRSIGIRCRGGQPWQFPNQRADCDVNPVIVQRGASNVHFPDIRSAIDIPPESDFAPEGETAARIRSNTNFELLERQPDHPMRGGLIALIATDEDSTEDEVIGQLEQATGKALTPPAGGHGDSEEAILRDEWTALTMAPVREPHPRDNFVTRHVDIRHELGPQAVPDQVKTLMSKLDDLVQVTRLREVRVLSAFSRYTQDALVRPDLGAGRNWLPGIETFGEGIFFSIKSAALGSWENGTAPTKAARVLGSRLANSYFARWLPDPTPRFLLLHTLAHILMRQLIFETGYSSASVRERIYADEREMAGVLIYTAAGDSEGTLGGLVRQGEARRFVSLLANALRQATWCSLDPVCGESVGQGTDALSLAACHGCSLVSETSCTAANVLLDRNLLIHAGYGFFSEIAAPFATSPPGVEVS